MTVISSGKVSMLQGLKISFVTCTQRLMGSLQHFCMIVQAVYVCATDHDHWDGSCMAMLCLYDFLAELPVNSASGKMI